MYPFIPLTGGILPRKRKATYYLGQIVNNFLSHYVNATMAFAKKKIIVKVILFVGHYWFVMLYCQ